jgi:hypothetical protein
MSWSQIGSTENCRIAAFTALTRRFASGSPHLSSHLVKIQYREITQWLGRFSVRLGELSVVKMLVNILHILHPLDWACYNAPTVPVVR